MSRHHEPVESRLRLAVSALSELGGGMDDIDRVMTLSRRQIDKQVGITPIFICRHSTVTSMIGGCVCVADESPCFNRRESSWRSDAPDSASSNGLHT